MANKKVTYEMMHDAMYDVISGLQDDTIKPAKAKEITNACGKVISMGLGRLQFALKNGASLEIPELGIGDMELSIAIEGKLKSLNKAKSYLDGKM